MDIAYQSKKLKKQLTQPKELIKSFGQMARKVNQRIEELKAATTLSVMQTIPAARCHELTGNRKGQLAVQVSVNYRLIFEPNHEPIPAKVDGGLDWEAVTAITIIDIEDYH